MSARRGRWPDRRKWLHVGTLDITGRTRGELMIRVSPSGRLRETLILKTFPESAMRHSIALRNDEPKTPRASVVAQVTSKMSA